MKFSIPLLVRFTVSAAATLIFTTTGQAQLRTNTAFVVYPEFQNVFFNSQNNLPIGFESWAIFSGSVGGYSPPGSGQPPVVPVSAEGIELVQCSFGEMLGRVVPYPEFELETIRMAQTILYPPAAALRSATRNSSILEIAVPTSGPGSKTSRLSSMIPSANSRATASKSCVRRSSIPPRTGLCATPCLTPIMIISSLRPST